MQDRGKIRDKDRARILKDYSGLKFERGITPTDIDGFLEFNNEIFVFLEIKFGKYSIVGGQRLALERLTDSVNYKESLLIVANHNIKPEDDKFIDVANCLVNEIRYKKKWFKINSNKNVRQIIDSFLLKNKEKTRIVSV